MEREDTRMCIPTWTGADLESPLKLHVVSTRPPSIPGRSSPSSVRTARRCRRAASHRFHRGLDHMARLLPDPTFYPSPAMAVEAPVETLAYVALLTPGDNGKKDALGVIDADPDSPHFGRLVNKVELPNGGNELHHFGWNACSSHLCAYAANPHVERRYLILPGTNSSRIHILDTHPDPSAPRLIKVIEPEEMMKKSGYSTPHTVHCGPDGIYINALGAPDGNGPGGIFMLDHDTFEVKGRWEKDRGPQQLAYDFWWHLGHDVMITSEWGTPNMVKDGLNPELLLAGKYGNSLHVWDLHKHRHLQKLELGAEPPLVTDINLSVDDQTLYVSCWGTGKLLQYDVSDPASPKLTATLGIGGIVNRTAHPRDVDRPLNGGPQMVEVSRDGKRVYLTNGLYSPWDAQFYPDGIRGWMAKIDADPNGGISFDENFLVEFEDGLRPHQVRLQGGDAS